MSLQTRFLNFTLFTSLPSTPSPSLFSRRDGVRRRRQPPAVPRVAPPAKPVLRALGFDETSLPGTSHARHAVERRRLAVAALDVRATRRRATVLAAAPAVLLGSRRQFRVRLYLSSR